MILSSMVSSVDDNRKSSVTSKRTIVFTGKPEDWEAFIIQWLAMYASKGWKGIMTGTEAVPTKTEVDDAEAQSSQSEDDKALLKRHEANVECFNMLLISIDASTHAGRLAFHLVITCKKVDYPEGNSKMAYDKLVSKYAPKNTQTELSLRKQLANTKLTHGHPDDFMMKIEVLAMEINAMTKSTSDISDHDLMAHILNNLPKDYDAITDGMERDFNEDTLTLDTLREKLQSRYKRLNQIEYDEENDSSPEQALVAINNFKRRFKGICWVCGKRGHRSRECSDKKEEEKANVAIQEESDDESELGF